ncbi:MAG: SRPBCC domain-containing protein [Caulobacterales bacterium]
MRVVELGPIVKTVEVRRNPADAFRVFTEEINAWWPMKRHSRAKDAAGEVTVRVAFETRVGGRIYETLNTGEERDWGEVLAFEPGKRVAFSFQMGRAKDKSGEVEVRFDPLDDKTCRVTLTHSHWERYEDAETMRKGFSGGWEAVFVEGFGGFAGTI